MHFKTLNPVKVDETKAIEKQRSHLEDLMAFRRRDTKFYREELFKPETEEEVQSKKDLFERVKATDKRGRLAKYGVIGMNVVIEHNVKKTKNLFKKADRKEDEINERLHKQEMHRNKQDGAVMHSNTH